MARPVSEQHDSLHGGAGGQDALQQRHKGGVRQDHHICRITCMHACKGPCTLSADVGCIGLQGPDKWQTATLPCPARAAGKTASLLAMHECTEAALLDEMSTSGDGCMLACARPAFQTCWLTYDNA